MLGGARPVVALDARRRPPPLADGPDSVAPLAAPAYALARATRRRGCAGVCCFEVRTEWLADCRAQDGAVDAADAVSSAFLRACDADVGFLGVDVRSRGLGCGPDDAGNHERVVVTRGPADDGTPTLVRRACGGLRGASRSPPPSAWSLLTATFAAAHDWTRPDAPASRAPASARERRVARQATTRAWASRAARRRSTCRSWTWTRRTAARASRSAPRAARRRSSPRGLTPRSSASSAAAAAANPSRSGPSTRSSGSACGPRRAAAASGAGGRARSGATRRARQRSRPRPTSSPASSPDRYRP